jgi:chemotaxis protein methyltransferase CheR
LTDRDCVAFLQWCLPKLGMRWEGFRKVRRQVCKRVSRRIEELDLPDAPAYRKFLNAHEAEWDRLGSLCRVTISRFYRDRGVFEALRGRVLPALAEAAARRGEGRIRCWSAGCASGEEPYTLAIVWPPRGAPDIALDITATDADEDLLERARRGRYPASSVKDLPPDLLARAFDLDGKEHVLRESFRRKVQFIHQDIRHRSPSGPFDLVLCRNLAFTYFDDRGREAAMAAIARGLLHEGVLVVGIHERLPAAGGGFEALEGAPGLYRYQAPTAG